MRPSEATRRLERIIDSDPANLRSLGKYAKGGKINPEHNKKIYMLLVIIPALALIATVFYCVA